MNVSTFKRFEKKYMITTDQYQLLLKRIKHHIIQDEFSSYTICNLYYDTDNYELIRHSIEKPIFKEKLRLRSYGVPNEDEPVFFEIKKKYKKEVFKRRISMNLAELGQVTEKEIDDQIANEINYFMDLYQPDPKVFIAYEREAFVSKNDSSLRITFDHNIRYRTDELDLRAGDYGTNILDDEYYLLEIKVQGSMPLWLTSALSDYSIYPHSFSKYGYTYQNFILNEINNKKEGIKHV